MRGGAIENYNLPTTNGGATENYNLPNTQGSSQQQQSRNQASRKCCGCPTCSEIFNYDGRLLRAIILIVILSNVPFGNFILYPFTLFSTWIHEMCHGMSALMMGGKIISLNVYSNGSGLAKYQILNTTSKYQLAFITSAGYCGTAVIGGIMLLFRRSKRAPRIGLCLIGILILTSTALLVRNTFGFSTLIPMGVLLIALGWKLPQSVVGDFYALLAATCCLNAILSVQVLYAIKSQEIGGQKVQSDATAMVDIIGFTSWFWATTWLGIAIASNVIGFMGVYCCDSRPRALNMSQAAEVDDENADLTSFSIEIS